ncbi:MAG: efflux RND transporter permease subunit [Patescibacteria group bacterium]
MVILLIVVILLLGTYAFANIPRRLNPEIKIPIVIISTVMPGASPQDIEELVTDPLESSIKSIKEIDTYTSVSRDSVSVISIQFVSGKDPDKAKDEVQSAIDTVTLPESAQDAKVRKLDFEDQPIWQFTVTTNSDPASFARFSKILKKNLEDGPYTDRVTISGIPEDEVSIVVDSAKAQEFGVNPQSIRSAIQASLSAIPAGTVESSSSTYTVATPKLVEGVDDIYQIPININGKGMKLKDIATVRIEPKRDSNNALFAQKGKSIKDSVTFAVYKTSKTNIDKAEESFRKIVDDTLKSYPKNAYEIHSILSGATAIEDQFVELVSEFRSAIILVFVVLTIFLGIRQAFISSLTFPLTFLSAFFLMNLAGLSIDFISLFGFLIALGLLIDDTIVTVTAMTRYFATGNFTGTETGLLVWRDFIVPLWSTTITTIWAFVPMLLTTGIIGEFVKPIPLVVTFNMISSTSIAVLITLPVMMRIFDKKLPARVKRLIVILLSVGYLALLYFVIPKTSLLVPTIISIAFLTFVLIRYKNNIAQSVNEYIDENPKLEKILDYLSLKMSTGFLNVESISLAYTSIIEKILKNKSLRRQVFAAIILFAIIGFALVPLGLVKNEFFPKSDNDNIFIVGDTGSTTSQKRVSEIMKLAMQKIINIDGIDFISGQSNTSVGGGMGGLQSENGHFTITIKLLKEEERKQKSFNIAENLRADYANFQGADITVVEESSGPPAGADVQIKYSGADLAQLETYANKTIDYLKTKKGVFNIDKSLPSSGSKIEFVPDINQIAESNTNSSVIGMAIRSALSGVEMGKLKVGDDEKDINLYFSKDTPSPEDLTKISIAGASANMPIDTFGRYELSPNPSSINREKGRRTVSVTASVRQGFSTTDINNELLTFAKEKLTYPSGYSYGTGGANEENAKSVQSIINAMGLAFLLIFVTMVIEFRSFRQAVITLCTIPIAVSAVMWVFAATGTALSFPALIGILALFGIVVTTAIVIVEKINENRAHGMLLDDAIIEAAGSRLEPIVLTSITTIVGLAPITIADPLWRGLGGAIIAGLLFSGMLKLFFIPIVYKAWMRDNED